MIQYFGLVYGCTVKLYKNTQVLMKQFCSLTIDSSVDYLQPKKLPTDV